MKNIILYSNKSDVDDVYVATRLRSRNAHQTSPVISELPFPYFPDLSHKLRRRCLSSVSDPILLLYTLLDNDWSLPFHLLNTNTPSHYSCLHVPPFLTPSRFNFQKYNYFLY